MIARGDLAIEAPLESVPIIQRHIITLGIQYAKPTIVATQMLASMVEAPAPTRAEVSDIASAVLTGADCLMLSDETANGRYPIEAVAVMKRVILYTEGQSPIKMVIPERATLTRQSAICQAIVDLASGVKAVAIVAETKSGATAVHISALRPALPLIAVTNDVRTAQQLAIVYAAKSYVRPMHKLAATRLTSWLREQKILSKGDVLVTASGRYPGVVGTTDTIKVRMLE
jgi:pyruvate kinase